MAPGLESGHHGGPDRCKALGCLRGGLREGFVRGALGVRHGIGAGCVGRESRCDSLRHDWFLSSRGTRSGPLHMERASAMCED